jgi:uncharacterized membrane protein
MAIPDYLGYHKELVAISGLFEILGALGILVPQTRLLAGYGLIALIIAVYPANINMALHPEEFTKVAKFCYIFDIHSKFYLFGLFGGQLPPKGLKKADQHIERRRNLK